MYDGARAAMLCDRKGNRGPGGKRYPIVWFMADLGISSDPKVRIYYCLTFRLCGVEWGYNM